MEAVFKQLEESGKTDVESLVKWIEDSHIIEAANEINIRELFDDVENQQHVELAKFMDVLATIATEQSQSTADLANQLASEAPRFVNAAIVGLNAFKRALGE